jgi:hypothetical protein
MTDLTDQFQGLPIEDLMCAPILAAAKGQAALCDVYLDYLYKLAWKNGKKNGELQVLSFELERPVIDSNGVHSKTTFSVEAPLISLVPIPSLAMEEVTVHFTMDVKMQHAGTESVPGGPTGSDKISNNNPKTITGLVTNKSEKTRSTDQSAKYDISVKATQQPPSEGMAKLTQIFASVIEPINSSAPKKSSDEDSTED